MKEEKTEYKSPKQKLLVFFEKSRNKWRDKAEERQKKIIFLNTKIRDLDKSRNLWKSRHKALSNKLAEMEKERAKMKKEKEADSEKKK